MLKSTKEVKRYLLWTNSTTSLTSNRVKSKSRTKAVDITRTGLISAQQHFGTRRSYGKSNHHQHTTFGGEADPRMMQAAVDVETDAMLQTTLRSNRFKDKTIITIAHRINTILDSDRVLVLQKGRVAEFDTPANLVRKQGLFYELVKEANLLGALDS